MKILSDVQKAHALSISKRPIWVIEMQFTNGVTVDGKNEFYFTSSELASEGITDGVARYDAAAVLIAGSDTPVPSLDNQYVMLDPESIGAISQRLDPVTGVSTIGTLSFKLVDYQGYLSTIINNADVAGYGLNRQFVNLFVLYSGDNWGEKQLVRRMQISDVASSNGSYKFTCQDVQRQAKKQVFSPNTAVYGGYGNVLVQGDLSATETILHLYNFEINGFQLVTDASHIKIDDEIMKVTARVEVGLDLKLTVIRGAVGTTAAIHALGADVTEVVRYTGDPLDIALAVLTGRWNPMALASGSYQSVDSGNIWMQLPSGYIRMVAAVNRAIYEQNGYVFVSTIMVDVFVEGAIPANAPDHWHCGMDVSSHISADEWTAMQIEKDTATTHFDFVFDKAVDGKLFVEKEIMQQLGMFMNVKGDGRLGLSAYKPLATDKVQLTSSNGGYENMVLDTDVCISWGDVTIVKSGDMMTTARIDYDRYPIIGGKFRRTALFTDTAAYNKHGKGRDFKVQSEGVIASNVKGVTAMFNRMSLIMARFSRPPMRLTVKCLPKMAAIEIGDIVRCNLPTVDPYTNQNLNRCFEVISTSMMPKTGEVSVNLISQAEAAQVQSFRKTSNYLDSAFLNGYAVSPAGRDVIRDTASFSGVTVTLVTRPLDNVDEYTVTFDANFQQSGDMYFQTPTPADEVVIAGVMMIRGTTRLFCNSWIRVDGSIIGTGGSLSFNGYDSDGSAGENGSYSNKFEYGRYKAPSLKYPAGRCSLDAPTTKTATIVPPASTGKGSANAGSIAIIPASIDANGKVPSLLGLVGNLDGSSGGLGGAGVDAIAIGESSGGTDSLVRAKWWANANGYTGSFNSYGGSAGAGGAGLSIIARRVNIVSGAGVKIDLSGNDGEVKTLVTSPRVEHEVLGCNDFSTYSFKAGNGGGGGGGSLLVVAENSAILGVYVNKNNVNLKGGGNGGSGSLHTRLI